MKKFIYVVISFMLTLAFCLSINSPQTSTPSTSHQLFARQLLGEHKVEALEPTEKHKVEISETEGGFNEEHGDGDREGLILNADYGGVKTHPSPQPNHPKP